MRERPVPTVTGDGSERGGAVRAIIVPVILIILGLGILVYPVVATQLRNAHQVERAQEYAEQIARVPATERDSRIGDAHEYNRIHADAPILDPWLARVSHDNVAYQEYLAELSSPGTDAMAQVVIPKAEVNLPVYHGSDTEVLQKGVGHLFGSALPVGGPGTHAVLTGHTGLTNATLFDNLTRLEEGDAFYVNTYGQKMKYQVDQIKVVTPDQVNDLRSIADRDLVTLVTCTPYGINSHRLLVRGTRVPVDEEALEGLFDEKIVVWQWWMKAVLAIAAIVLLLLILWIGRAIRRDRRCSQERGSAAVDAERNTPGGE